MTREDLLALHTRMTEKARQLMSVKNADYGANKNPFRNFDRHGLYGILVRISDKLARLETFTERGELSVKDETVQDTLMDLINYAVLFAGYIEHTKEPHAN